MDFLSRIHEKGLRQSWGDYDLTENILIFFLSGLIGYVSQREKAEERCAHKMVVYWMTIRIQ